MLIYYDCYMFYTLIYTCLMFCNYYFSETTHTCAFYWTIKTYLILFHLRFLNAAGELLPPDHPVRQNIVAFGAGTRICPAASFARSRIFLIVANLVRTFEFYPLEKFPLPSEDPRDWADGDVIKAPGNFRCGLKQRQLV